MKIPVESALWNNHSASAGAGQREMILWRALNFVCCISAAFGLSWNFSLPEPNGQAIGDRPGPWDNFTKKVGPVAAPGGQLTLKDDSEAKIPKGPKIKEKNLKSDKPEPSEKAQESDKTKKKFQPSE